MDIVLLHGMARSRLAMLPMARYLESEGHRVFALDYRSRSGRLRDHALNIARRLEELGLIGLGDELGFVAHSMGGLVWRSLPGVIDGFSCGRSVLLGSPIAGSIVAERFGDNVALRTLYGPALADLAPERVARLPEPPGPFGVVAGTRVTRLLPAASLLALAAPGEPSDSTVLVRETRHAAMADFVTVPVAHTFLANDANVKGLVARFVLNGTFAR